MRIQPLSIFSCPAARNTVSFGHKEKEEQKQEPEEQVKEWTEEEYYGPFGPGKYHNLIRTYYGPNGEVAMGGYPPTPEWKEYPPEPKPKQRQYEINYADDYGFDGQE
jgi:hypothetical protein